MDDKAFWNDAYRQDPRFVDVADHFLDTELQDLTPGSALDLGCGSGANVFPAPDDPRRHAGTATTVAFVRARKP